MSDYVKKKLVEKGVSGVRHPKQYVLFALIC